MAYFWKLPPVLHVPMYLLIHMHSYCFSSNRAMERLVWKKLLNYVVVLHVDKHCQIVLFQSAFQMAVYVF